MINESRLDSLEINMSELERRVRESEDLWDTYMHSPVWKRILFWADGWPTKRLDAKPQWRPWRRWWTS